LLLPDHPLTYFFVMTQLYGKKGIASSTFLKGCTFSKSWTFSVPSVFLPYPARAPAAKYAEKAYHTGFSTSSNGCPSPYDIVYNQ
ncbi:hypothetical protein, partial [Paenibacillus sp. MMS18-CY102]|uniref:hypothetical protein n=1 Tax=Paenibacillus sp. MMS18-CY102 TaxID=2682849 RepID=UPI001F1B19EE